ncbi:MAG: hypothetical protein E6041_05260 [Escherichia coli]|uniref:hypothetical protein n=1 Tax=Negativicoccus succinicivorans TaxID=620903 RepID=UPI00290882C2|nr:hypothetical protein [Negativicoccus succinicivorans]MDU5530527.1 hypothetical protein [Negativicoccus succinicivorans]MDU5591246.1 hypothetical protein [Escherichia coli]
MIDVENPMVIERRTAPRPQVYKVNVKAVVYATIDIVANDEEEIDRKIDSYADSILAEADNCEIDGWDVVYCEDAED